MKTMTTKQKTQSDWNLILNATTFHSFIQSGPPTNEFCKI